MRPATWSPKSMRQSLQQLGKKGSETLHQFKKPDTSGQGHPWRGFNKAPAECNMIQRTRNLAELVFGCHCKTLKKKLTHYPENK